MRYDFFVRDLEGNTIALVRELSERESHKWLAEWLGEPGQVAGVFQHLADEPCYSLTGLFGKGD